MKAQGTQKYLPSLQALVEGYNAGEHHSAGLAPREMRESNKRVAWENVLKTWVKRTPRQIGHFKVGDRVRLSQHKCPFQCGYKAGWTEEVFWVKRIVPGLVKTYRKT